MIVDCLLLESEWTTLSNLEKYQGVPGLSIYQLNIDKNIYPTSHDIR